MYNSPVLVSTEFTLLSNRLPSKLAKEKVLVSTEFTLLSNKSISSIRANTVLVSTEFTLLSNLKSIFKACGVRIHRE